MNEPRSNRTGLVVAGGCIAFAACLLCIAAIAVGVLGVTLSETPHPTRAALVTPGETRTPRPTVTPGPAITLTPRPQAVTPVARLEPPSTLRRDPVPPEASDTT